MKKGDEVTWNWGKGKAGGKIIKEYDKPVEKTIKGTKVKRNADKNEAAYEIKQKNGNTILKSASELKKHKPS